MTVWNKKVFPLVWFGSLAYLAGIFISLIARGEASYPILLLPLLMAGVGYVLMRWLVFPLVDEVFLEDDQVVVINKGQEDRFPITHIINVDCHSLMNPESIVLTLKEPSKFGPEIMFSPPLRMWPLSRHPVATELIERANR